MHRDPPIRRRGFSLIEAVVVVGIISVLAAMAGTGIIYGTGRAALNNTAFEISAMVSIAQMRAASTGRPHFIAFLPDQVVVVDDATHITGFDASNPATLGGTVVERVRIRAPISYAKPVITTLVAPFATVPIASSGTTGMLLGCSSCDTGTGGGRGVLEVSPDGLLEVKTGTGVKTGIAITFTSTKSAETQRTKTLVISAPMGAVKLF